MTYGEGSLVQQTTADYLHDQLGWESVFAYNEETFGSTGTLGRSDDREIILSRYLRKALAKFSPNLPQTAYDDAVRTLTDYAISPCVNCGCAGRCIAAGPT